jgi:hypothetical protein
MVMRLITVTVLIFVSLWSKFSEAETYSFSYAVDGNISDICSIEAALVREHSRDTDSLLRAEANWLACFSVAPKCGSESELKGRVNRAKSALDLSTSRLALINAFPLVIDVDLHPDELFVMNGGQSVSSLYSERSFFFSAPSLVRPVAFELSPRGDLIYSSNMDGLGIDVSQPGSNLLIRGSVSSICGLAVSGSSELFRVNSVGNSFQLNGVAFNDTTFSYRFTYTDPPVRDADSFDWYPSLEPFLTTVFGFAPFTGGEIELMAECSDGSTDKVIAVANRMRSEARRKGVLGDFRGMFHELELEFVFESFGLAFGSRFLGITMASPTGELGLAFRTSQDGPMVIIGSFGNGTIGSC